MAKRVKPKRRYHSPHRQEQAAATRVAILEAAHRLFERHGYGTTTMAAIAAEAGVALKTVYLAFETKSGVLRALWNLRLRAGLDEVPIAQQEWYREALQEPRSIALGVDDLRERLAHGICVQLDAIAGGEAAVAPEQLVEQAAQDSDLGVVGDRLDAQEPVPPEPGTLRLRQPKRRLIGARSHCFSAPAHMPCTKRRCVATNSATTGSATITAAAAMPTRSVV